MLESWEECRKAVHGYNGAEYKGFATLREAEAYLGEAVPGEEGQTVCLGENDGAADCPRGNDRAAVCLRGNHGAAGSLEGMKKADFPHEGKEQAADTLLAYVDGSYDDSLKKYAFGCVFLLPDGRVYTECGNGDNPQSLQQRNVTGEMLGAMYAVRVAMENNYARLEIYYDYQGIEKWVTGEWRARTELTGKYAEAMRGWAKRIKLSFIKVPAHSRVYYNEMADRVAKRGLTEGQGIPGVKKLEEMREEEQRWNRQPD